MPIVEVNIAAFFEDEANLVAFEKLAEENRAEVEGALAEQVVANLSVYAQLQEKGLLIALGAFDEGKMVGYACALIAPNLHYGYLMAVNDTVFVSECYRGKGYGLRLMREMERRVKAQGARFMVWQAKIDSSLNKVLPRLGYRAEEVNYIKEL